MNHYKKQIKEIIDWMEQFEDEQRSINIYDWWELKKKLKEIK